jgi:hypothetical protein
MQLDYNILFIDDDGFEGFMGVLKTALETYLQDNGFLLQGVEVKSENDLDVQLSSNVNYDIIFVDNRFDDKECRIDFIKKKKNKKIYADIVLCTAQPDNELKKLINAETALHGFYYIRKGNSLYEHVYDIINFRLNKVLDTNVMRGIAMAEVAKFDAHILDILKREEEKYKPHIITKIKNKTKERHNKFQEANMDEEIWGNVSDPDKSTLYFDSSMRKDIFHSHVLKSIDKLKECYTAIKDNYKNNVLDKRNVLAHQIEPKLSDDEKKQLRIDIIKFRKIFEKIQKYFNGDPL